VRSFLRAVAALVGFYLAVTALTFPLTFVLARLVGDEGLRGIVSVSGATVLAAVVVYLALLRVGWATRQMVGWPPPRLVYKSLVAGAAIGLLMAAVAIGLALAAGSARIASTGESLAELLPLGGALAVGLLLAALAEELLFRGYPLARLSAVLGKTMASVLLAAVFALAHWWNPNVSALGLVNIALAALVLSAAFFTPGGLPAAWGVHWGWNAGLSLLADAPVSGLQFDLPGYDFVTNGPAWFTGGSFGPEGGLMATLVMAAALAWLVRNNVRSTEDRP
jgi:membrane protease YdiL (CAAX protease family)